MEQLLICDPHLFLLFHRLDEVEETLDVCGNVLPLALLRVQTQARPVFKHVKEVLPNVVSDFDSSVLGHEDVAGLQVDVEYVQGVEVLHCLEDLNKELLEDLFVREVHFLKGDGDFLGDDCEVMIVEKRLHVFD